MISRRSFGVILPGLIVSLALVIIGACGGEGKPPSPVPTDAAVFSPTPDGPQTAEGSPTPPATLPSPSPFVSPPPPRPPEKSPVIPPLQTEEARRLYPPDLTRAVLLGDVSTPAGFDECLSARGISEERLSALRSGKEAPSGLENDAAALCLLELGIPPESLEVSVNYVSSQYRTAPSGLSGWFREGQSADLLLSGIAFNNSGGPLFFNHPKGIASDGTHLLLADGNNNRVLIWNSLPTGNVPPDLVLGQPDFTSNYAGSGRHQMNWPVAVSTDGTRIVVADTNNDRILIWNQFPMQNGAPADIVLDGGIGNELPPGSAPSKYAFSWPWGVWTDGKKLVVSSTRTGYVLVWNTFPTRDNQPADLYLTAGGDMGTPRSISSNGQYLIVGDHNAENTSHNIGNFVWKSFPVTDDAPYDFFFSAPYDPHYCWMHGTSTADGRLLMLGRTLHIWNSFPQGPDDPPDLTITGFTFDTGDGVSLALAGERLYLSLYNGNRVVGYDHIPTSPEEKPAFAIGSPDISTNTLQTHYFITNGVPASDGRSLFVSSDFDRKLYVWKNIPDESGAYPDLIYSLPEEPWDNALWGNALVLAGRDTVYVWEELPTGGQLPDAIYRGSLGGITLRHLTGVALDDRYLYLADYDAGKVYVWNGIPETENDAPAFSLSVNGPWRLSSDGEYLAVTAIYEHGVYLYRVADLSSGSKPVKIGGPGTFNLPQNAIVSHGALFVADTGFHRVHIWRHIADALAGKSADLVLGKGGPGQPPSNTSDAFYNPAGLAFDGNYLWIGEFKFSFRLLRFSVR